MRLLLWISATYFLLSLTALLVSRVDLPPAFYALFVMIFPLVWLGRLTEPILSILRLWSSQGPSGWVNYEGPSFGGLLLIAIVGLAVTALLLLYAYRQDKSPAGRRAARWPRACFKSTRRW